MTIFVATPVPYPPSEGAWLSVTVSSVVSASEAAVTVTVWRTLQFVIVKVRLEGLTETSVLDIPVMVTVTLAVGAFSNQTW